MKRFRFKLAAVLGIRKNREDDALRSLGAAQRAYQEEISKKAQMVSDLSEALDRREFLGVEPVGALAFKLEEDFIQGTKYRITRADRDIVRASRVVEKALRVYLQARRQTRMLEILNEKERAEFLKQRAKLEQRNLDDMMIMRERLKTDHGHDEDSEEGAA